ncbi:HAMP domain-containing protein, partial [Microbacterium sp.]|uniref:HAMP domain-containing protein n=1 Tax=Microbacterium sp. TaxID=51671 RepID=UPI0028118952
MKASLTPRSWTSRARLTAAIAITLAVGGTFLLVAQYALFTALLNREVEANRAQVDQALESVPGLGPEDFEVLYDGSHGPAGLSSDPVIAQALRNGLGWSALLLGVFIAVAVGWAWFLSRRSLRRISRLTSATSEITEHDLSQRLALQGPPDEITQLGDTIDSMIERLEQA